MTKRDVFWQHDLSISYKLIGDVLQAQGNLSESIVASQRDLAVSHGKVAMVLARQGEWKRALSAFRQGREIIVKLKAAAPSNATLPKDLAWLDGQIRELEKR